jgi:hypothetical protein
MHHGLVITQEVAACFSATPYLQAPPITRLDHSPREVILVKLPHHTWFPSFSETLYSVLCRLLIYTEGASRREQYP